MCVEALTSWYEYTSALYPKSRGNLAHLTFVMQKLPADSDCKTN